MEDIGRLVVASKEILSGNQAASFHTNHKKRVGFDANLLLSTMDESEVIAENWKKGHVGHA